MVLLPEVLGARKFPGRLFRPPGRLLHRTGLAFSTLQAENDVGTLPGIGDVANAPARAVEQRQRVGVPIETALQFMRHPDIRVTARVYTDPTPLDTVGAVAKLPKRGGIPRTQEGPEEEGGNENAAG